MMLSKLSRLRQVDAAELAWRARGAADIVSARLATRVRSPRWDRRRLRRALRLEVLPADLATSLAHGEWARAHGILADHFTTRPARFVIAPGMRASLPAEIQRRFPHAARDAAARADRIMGGRYDILGYDALPFDGRRWHHDPVHGTTAPQRFWSTVPYLSPECGDHKVVWELNRHQHWIELGRAYWLTGDERYRGEYLAQLASWMSTNPPLVGMNWASMLELAFRTLSWTWALQFFTRAGAVDSTPWTVDLLLAVDRQLAHIERHLSYYFSPNTHLLGEALALYVVSRALPELKGSARREETGRRVLLQEINRQIGADGGHCERSTHYHRYTLDFYLLALAVARITDDPVAAVFERTSARLADAARALCDDRGRFPHLGDDDGGTLLPLTHRAADDMRDSLAMAAALTGRLQLLIDGDAEEMWWMLGHPRFADAVARVEGAPRAVPQTSVALASTGYYISRADGDHLVIDGGPHGYMNAGHAHADALSLTLTRHGKPLLIDTGTGCYTVDPQMRDRFRSSALHNTLTLDERSQSLPRGPFHWHTVANGATRRWRTNRRFDYFVGTHDGYAPRAHCRHVLMLHDDLLVVADYVGLAGAAGDRPSDSAGAVTGEMLTARVHWHIGPEWTVTVADQRATLGAGDDVIEVVSTAGMVEHFHGSEATGLGWHSPVYGRVAATSTLRLTTQSPLPLWVISVFGMQPANAVGRVSATPLSVTAGHLLYGTAIRIERACSVDCVMIAEPATDRAGVVWRTADLVSDAAMAFSRSSADVAEVLALVDVSTVQCTGAPAFGRTYPARISDVFLTAACRATTPGMREDRECAELLDSLTAPQ